MDDELFSDALLSSIGVSSPDLGWILQIVSTGNEEGYIQHHDVRAKILGDLNDAVNDARLGHAEYFKLIAPGFVVVTDENRSALRRTEDLQNVLDRVSGLSDAQLFALWTLACGFHRGMRFVREERQIGELFE